MKKTALFTETTNKATYLWNLYSLTLGIASRMTTLLGKQAPIGTKVGVVHT